MIKAIVMFLYSKIHSYSISIVMDSSCIKTSTKLYFEKLVSKKNNMFINIKSNIFSKLIVLVL